MNGAVERLAGLGFEAKAVRRVRTPGGAAHYGQPIGTVIVRDSPVLGALTGLLDDGAPTLAMATGGKPRGGILKKAKKSDYDGWEMWEDGDTKWFVGKENGEWIAVDENDQDLTSSYKAKADVLAAMHARYMAAVPDSELTQFPRRVSRGKYRKFPSDDVIAKSKLREVTSERELYEHSKKYGYRVPDDAVNVYISDDPEGADTQYYAYYLQKDAPGRPTGKWQGRQRPAVAEKNAASKFDRIEQFREDVKKVDEQLTIRKVNADDTLAVVALMRRLGARVGSSEGGDDRRGITQLKQKDVTFSNTGKSVSIQYSGKMKSIQTYESDDPLIVGLLKSRYKKMDRDNPDERFFPGVTSKMTLDRVANLTGKSYKNHDFRTLFATESASKLMKMSKYRKPPKDEAEVRQRITEIGAIVDEQLNDRNQAVKSYIDPRVFAPWFNAIKKEK